MQNYKITCSSTCDLKPEQLKQMDVAYANYHYIIDGVDHLDDLFVSQTAEQFYKRIDEGVMPTTSQVTPEELIDVIEPILASGYDVLHIEFSSGLSGGVQSALNAKKILSEKYPERKILVVDSLAASTGYGLLVTKAVQLKNEGKSIEEVRDWIEENKLYLRHWFFSTNLTHFKRGGRLSSASAFVGTLLGVCPVMEMNSEGKLVVRKKVIGKKKAKKELVKIMCEQAQGLEDYSDKCYMCNSIMLEDAQDIATALEGQFTKLDGKVEIHNIGTVIGSHTGPGCVALFFFAKDKREI